MYPRLVCPAASPCTAVPLHRLRIVLWYAAALSEHVPKVVLSCCLTVFDRPLVPSHRFVIILRHTTTGEAHVSETSLSQSETLQRRATVPLHRLCIVLKDTIAARIHIPKTVLRLRISSLCTHAYLPSRVTLARENKYRGKDKECEATSHVPLQAPTTNAQVSKIIVGTASSSTETRIRYCPLGSDRNLCFSLKFSYPRKCKFPWRCHYWLQATRAKTAHVRVTHSPNCRRASIAFGHPKGWIQLGMLRRRTSLVSALAQHP